MSPLFSGIVAANVLLMGFVPLVALGGGKESEKLTTSSSEHPGTTVGE